MALQAQQEDVEMEDVEDRDEEGGDVDGGRAAAVGQDDDEAEGPR